MDVSNKEFSTLFYVKNTETDTLITCAYKEATLVNSSSLNGPAIGQKIYAGQGPDAKNLTIRAEVLYLQPDKEYSFPGKNVTIIARKLSVMSKGSVTFSVNGLSGASHGKDIDGFHPSKAHSGDHGISGQNPTKGGAGTTGASRNENGGHGDHGKNAGNISIFAESLDDNLHLILNAKGGDGARGGKGAPGQDGGNGGDGGHVEGSFTEGQEPENCPGGNSGGGGNGTNGGNGGNAGNGGNIEAICEHKSDQIESNCMPGNVGKKGIGGSQGWAGQPGKGGGPCKVEMITLVPGGRFDIPVKSQIEIGKAADGKWNNSGTPGSNGIDGHPGKPGLPKITSNFTSGSSLLSKLAPHFINMILRRLEFFYLTHVTAMPLDELTSDAFQKKQTDINSFKDTLEWLKKLLNLKDGDEKKNFQDLINKLNLLLNKIKSKKDYYNNHFNAIPQLNWDFKDFNTFNASFQKIDTEFRMLESQFETYKSRLNQIKDSFNRFQEKFHNAQKKEKDYETQLQNLSKTIDDHSTEAEKARRQLEINIASLQQLIENKVGCKWKDIGDSIGILLLLSAGEFKPATALGGALSLAGAAEERGATVDLGPNGKVNRKYLTSNIQTITGGIQNLKEGYQKAKGFITEEDPNGGRLLLEKQMFERIYSDYLSQIESNGGEAAKEVRQLFEDYLNAIQERNQSIDEYNATYAEYEETLAAKQSIEKQKNYLEGNLEKLNDEHNLDVLFDYYSKAILTIRLQMIYDLYSFCRAYRCLTLKESKALLELSGLQSWDQLGPGRFKIAIDTLATELNEFKTSLGSHRRAEWNTVYSIGKNHPSFLKILEQLKSNQTFHFDLKLDDANNPFKGKADVRLEDLEVQLKGIESDENQEISMSIRPFGFYQIQDIYKKVFDFVLAGEEQHLDIPYSYSYKDPQNVASYKRTTKQKSNGETQFVFGERGQGISYSLFSPFSRWQVKIINKIAPKSIDHIEEIILNFRVTYRNFE